MKYLLVCVLLAFTFQGCILTNQKVDNDVKKELKKIKIDEKLLSEEEIKEIVRKDKYVDLTVPKNLTTALSELSNIHNTVYTLNYTDSDIELPVLPNNSIKIKTFDDLKNLVADLSNYEIYIVKGKIFKDKPKVVSVRNTKADFRNIIIRNLKSNGELSVVDAISIFMQKTGYNVIYEQGNGNISDNDTSASNNVNETSPVTNIDYFKDKYINVKEIDGEKLLYYLSESLDLFFTINPKKNIVKFTKFKMKHLKLTIQNKKLISNSSEQNPTGEKTLYNEVEDTLNEIIQGKSTEVNRENGYARVLSSGNIIVFTTMKKMEAIEKQISEYNKIYSQSFIVKLTMFNLLVSKDNNFGIDFDIINKEISLATNFSKNTFVNYTKNLTGVDKTSVILNSLSNYGVVTHYSTSRYNLINNITKPRKENEKQEYFQKTELTEVGKTDSGLPLYKEVPTIATADNGFDYKITASSNGEIINLNMDIEIDDVIEIKEVTINDDTVTLLNGSEKEFDIDLTMFDGETQIAETYTTKERASNYTGVVPVENFIIGGSSDDKYVKKVVVIAAEVKRRKR